MFTSNSCTVVATSYDPKQYLPRHQHSEARIIFVMRGGFTETSSKSKYFYTPNDVLFRMQDEPHSNTFDPKGAICLNASLKKDWIDRYAPDTAKPHAGAIRLRAVDATLPSKLFRELRYPDELSPLMIEGLMLEVLALFFRHHQRSQTNAPPAWLARAIELLHADFASTVTLRRLSEELGIEEREISRVFRLSQGCSVGEYVRRLRIDRASELLAGTPKPLAAIAVEVGFFDQPHFTRSFRMNTGISPLAYRRLRQKI